ncbi:thioredoxin family protein [Shimia sp.]|uniref:thioredoxin family protein n=1 Tax=Shimia sp. TaxID=1954381 RepID=UPI003299343E
MAATPPVCEFGWNAAAFSLPATDGLTYSLQDVAGQNGLLAMFICNHCPYVRRVLDDILSDAADLKADGIGVVAISSNDAVAYPADGFDEMRKLGLPFPYLYDESQSVAKSYDAACTPDFFGFNADLKLQYRGRLLGPLQDDGAPSRDLRDAMRQIAKTGKGPASQVPSMGCSIKWKVDT